ncbi:MAG: hypothetical protein K5917_04405 [Clostridiales bacterium]|nr:hypothetical protein [Clostridiales bacterium]
MGIEDIISLLEQKKILITEVFDISKKIEIYVKDDNSDFLVLLDKRESLLKRAAKCNSAIKNIINNEESELSEEETQRLQKIIFEDEKLENLSADELKIIEFIEENKKMFKKAVELNESITTLVKREYEKTKKDLAKERSTNSNNLFR